MDEVRRTAPVRLVSAVLMTVREVARRPEAEPARAEQSIDLLQAALTVPRQRS